MARKVTTVNRLLSFKLALYAAAAAGCLLSSCAVRQARGQSAAADEQMPDYQRAATQSGDWRYEQPAEPRTRPRAAQVRPAGYEWHASRPRRQLSEAPRFAPGASGTEEIALLPEQGMQLDGNVPTPRSRARYRSTSSRQYDLPQSVEVLPPQSSPLPGNPRGNAVYDDGRFGPGSTGPVPDGYDANGFAPDGYGPGPDGYDDGGECIYTTRCPYCANCCGGISCHHRWLEESSVFAGVHAFKGGLDQGQNGNFGFQEGVNFAGSLWHAYGIGYQVGAQWLQSDLSGSNIANAFNNSRQQVFLTGGLFRRATCGHGWQGGAVFDWLDDNFYANTRFSQIRGEVSYIASYGNEFGFWGAFGTSGGQSVAVNNTVLTFGPTNLYAFFYRKNLANGGQGRVWGGFTSGDSGGLFGADYRVHMSNAWDLVGGFNYLIPSEGKDNGGATQESWGLMMNLVWYPTRPWCGIHNGPFRQLFNVADNNVFMVRQK